MLQVDEANCAGNSNCRIGKMFFGVFFTTPLSDQRIAAIQEICDRSLGA